ncbi:pseudouridine synthase, RluA family [Solidesulfovibrio carbinoliphilus subsp. oakridgensis]|uniref:Dephospho-CoA kinase n=1 Tax=Solidesulfovibrio carbinoliphilus subsp. oakridgensis TaxID=694327 RepID=G7QE34_9BACT|nr:dephospho-CoA kinase [Solidesulfovibrio carbinoliphilus]EHJ46690.1 pseudouridine synthase, RluA family [Solidesulfovibrio carbinoliphilus subsp. oakridgensis]
MENEQSLERRQAVFDPTTDGGVGTRLDVFWSARLADLEVSRARVRAAIEGGLATVDGADCRKPGLKLRGGETLTLNLPQVASETVAEAGSLRVLYADKELAVLDKPPGLTVHPAPGLPEGTLVNRLLHHFPGLREMAGERPGIVHRLDKDTSGLLMVALTEPVRLALAADFAARQVHKTYLALVHGRPDGKGGDIRLPIGRDPKYRTKMAVPHKGGRPAHSRWRPVWTAPDGTASLLEVTIFTGRTHQIRVHMAAIGHPIIGDAVYGPHQHAAWKRRGGAIARLASRQMLHAWKLSFTHPVLKEPRSFTCPPPPDFWRLLLLLGRRCQRIGVVGMPGCGKSTLLARFGAAGCPVFSADAAVASLYAPGGAGAHMLSRRFGDVALAEDGSVDKAWLLAGMRGTEKFRRDVMELVHPLVKGELAAFTEAHIRERTIFAEVPLLFESGWPQGEIVDMVVGVRCGMDKRRERLAAGRGWDDALIDRMDGWQWAEEAKLAKCRFVVDNNGDTAALNAQADRILGELARLRREDLQARYQWLIDQGYAGTRKGAATSSASGAGG